VKVHELIEILGDCHMPPRHIHLVTLPTTTVWQAGWTGFQPSLIALSKQPWITPGKTA